MRALLQRVTSAHVSVDGQTVGQIGIGLVVLLGVHRQDTVAQADRLAEKVCQLRVFSDAEGKMNLSVKDVQGQLLIISQFTLYGETRKGNRPSYSSAASPECAKPLYEHFVNACRHTGLPVATGVFQAHMDVSLTNSGPVTLLCNSEPEDSLS